MTDAASHWKRLRLKIDPTADDPDYWGTQVTPNRLTALVGGTTTAGTYSLIITGFYIPPEGRAQVEINATISFVRAAENDSQIATGLDTAFDLATVRPGCSTRLIDCGFSCSVSTATLTILFPPGFYGTLTNSAPGSATITQAIGSAMPITGSASLYGRAGSSSPNGVTVMWNCYDEADGTVLLAPGSATASLQAIELAEIETPNADGSRSYTYVVGATAVLAATTPGTPYELPLRGAKYWTVRFLTDANLPVGTASIGIIYRDSAT